MFLKLTSRTKPQPIHYRIDTSISLRYIEEGISNKERQYDAGTRRKSSTKANSSLASIEPGALAKGFLPIYRKEDKFNRDLISRRRLAMEVRQISVLTVIDEAEELPD
ncbi:hypothetical protein TNCT_324161 [Trichonephila clavata]|uniref:Uncharacterized protein n=1 Tax=Trichonephila clavata TaxID=2740835 RepID=A0A8X6F5Q4_TRICU|nr:hypothetical protein TNCT_106001 [Trichonephila clavata]GFR25039.1 hypothetical protein TNCT_324161 [Trichonephila clavata]